MFAVSSYLHQTLDMCQGFICRCAADGVHRQEEKTFKNVTQHGKICAGMIIISKDL